MQPTFEPIPMANTLLSYGVIKLATQLTSLPYFPMDDQLFLFPRHRRKCYSEALQSLLSADLTKRDAMIKSFVKCEKIKIIEEDKDPRMIQARTPRWNVELGKFTRLIEHQLYQIRSHKGNRIIAKGLTPRRRAYLLKAVWEQWRQPVALSLDLSRWDMHVRKPLMEAMQSVYLAVMPSPYLKWLIENLRNNVGITSQGVMFKRPDGVTSGDMTTALGNCTAVVVIIFSLLEMIKQKSIRDEMRVLVESDQHAEPEDLSNVTQLMNLAERIAVKQKDLGLPTPLDLIDDGDDHVIITTKELAKPIGEALTLFYRMIGHKLTVEGITTEFEKITFCQSRPVELRQGWVMAQNPDKVLASAFMIPQSFIKDPEEYMSQMFTGRAILHAGEPILGPLFQKLAERYPCRSFDWTSNEFRTVFQGLNLRINQLVEEGYDYSWHQVRDLNDDITHEVRAKYFLSWGIDVDKQLEYERMVIPHPQGPYRSLVYHGTPMKVIVDTVTDTGIVPEYHYKRWTH